MVSGLAIPIYAPPLLFSAFEPEAFFEECFFFFFIFLACDFSGVGELGAELPESGNVSVYGCLMTVGESTWTTSLLLLFIEAGGPGTPGRPGDGGCDVGLMRSWAVDSFISAGTSLGSGKVEGSDWTGISPGSGSLVGGASDVTWPPKSDWLESGQVGCWSEGTSEGAEVTMWLAKSDWLVSVLADGWLKGTSEHVVSAM